MVYDILLKAGGETLLTIAADPKPFVWTASATSIIEKVNRGKRALESQH